MRHYYHQIASSLGKLTLIVNEAEEVTALTFRGSYGTDLIRACDAKPDTDVTREATRQLEEYFEGTRQEFELKLNPAGTPFQKKVWRELRKIPFGETRSYRHIATRVGLPGASRAVGTANGANPIPIIVPCHRVINADGKLGGYSGGLDIKRKLLALEKNPSESILAALSFAA